MSHVARARAQLSNIHADESGRHESYGRQDTEPPSDVFGKVERLAVLAAGDLQQIGSFPRSGLRLSDRDETASEVLCTHGFFEPGADDGIGGDALGRRTGFCYCQCQGPPGIHRFQGGGDKRWIDIIQDYQPEIAAGKLGLDRVRPAKRAVESPGAESRTSNPHQADRVEAAGATRGECAYFVDHPLLERQMRKAVAAALDLFAEGLQRAESSTPRFFDLSAADAVVGAHYIGEQIRVIEINHRVCLQSWK